MLKSLENIWVTLDPVAMACKCKAEHKKPWEEKGVTMCKEVLNNVDQALDQAKKLNATKSHLKILDSRCKRQMEIAKWWRTRKKFLKTS